MARFRKRNVIRDRIVPIPAFCAAFAAVLFALFSFKGFFPNLLPDESEDQHELASESEMAPGSPETSDSYLLPTDTEFITYSDLERFTKEEIVLIRNELYARHGYNFQNETIRAYFETKDWYNPVSGINASNFDASCFNEYESANIATILAYEEGRRDTETPPDAGSQNEDSVIDHLVSKDDIKCYSLEMSECGDVIIFVTGLQEEWDGYPYHWCCTVYEYDTAAVLASANVRGYSKNYGPTILSIPKLDSGTYHVQMESAGSVNPLMTTFTDDPYSIQILKYYSSTPFAYDGDGIQTFHNANDILWTFDGTGFLKRNDGECFGALMKTKRGDCVPVLIGTEESAVEYIVSSTGEIVSAEGPFRHENSGVDYYYSNCGNIKSYTNQSPKTSSLPILFVNTTSPSIAAGEMADKMLEEALGEKEYWWLINGGKVKVACMVLIGLVVFIALCVLFGRGSGGDSGGTELDETGSIDEIITALGADGV